MQAGTKEELEEWVMKLKTFCTKWEFILKDMYLYVDVCSYIVEVTSMSPPSEQCYITDKKNVKMFTTVAQALSDFVYLPSFYQVQVSSSK